MSITITAIDIFSRYDEKIARLASTLRSLVGTELPDPSGFLEGSGKAHRYVDIKTGKDIQNSALKKLLAAALAAYKKRKT